MSDHSKQKIIEEGKRIAKEILKDSKQRKEKCMSEYSCSENGEVFCRRVKGHKGSCSSVVYWGADNV